MSGKELVEPQFGQENQFIVARDKQFISQDEIYETLWANVVILSYNRPRMLKEAIESVVSQNYSKITIWILDDYSDFDHCGLVNSFERSDIMCIHASPYSSEERSKRTRIAENINRLFMDCLFYESNDVVYYLCDDDLMADNWIRRSTYALSMVPEAHVAQGQAFSFNDGENPEKDAVYGLPGDNNSYTLYWATGSFCHLVKCWTDEEIYWHDNTYGHSQDIDFINEMMSRHPKFLVLDTPALYRREHPKTLSSLLGRKDKTGRYKKGYIPPKISPNLIEGLME